MDHLVLLGGPLSMRLRHVRLESDIPFFTEIMVLLIQRRWNDSSAAATRSAQYDSDTKLSLPVNIVPLVRLFHSQSMISDRCQL